jgi:hypothetical protein
VRSTTSLHIEARQLSNSDHNSHQRDRSVSVCPNFESRNVFQDRNVTPAHGSDVGGGEKEKE